MIKATAIDLFSGCGGLTLGLKQAGFRVIGAVELDPFVADVYHQNHPRTYVWKSDIRVLSPKSMLGKLKLGAGDLDLLAGCPPCQGFSTLRTRNGAKQNRDHRNDLAREVIRFVREMRPKAVMLENVPGLAGRRPFMDLCGGLRRVGYKINWGVKEASRFGVPQRRRRLILLAGLGFEIPFAPETRKLMTVRDAIGWIPKAGKSGDPLHDLPENHSPRILKFIKDIPKDGGDRLSLPRWRQLACHKRCDGFKDIYGRMAWNDVSPTITGGCFNPSKGRFLHPEENRAITLREASLLQTFPPNYRFPEKASKQVAALMIGNAFPPRFIRPHAAQIIRCLKKV